MAQFNTLTVDQQNDVIESIIEANPEYGIDADILLETLVELNPDVDLNEDGEIEDVNDDGDDDVTISDTNDDGNPDTAVVTADSKAEEKDAIKAAKEKLGIDEQTSTGKTKLELSDKNQKRVLPKKDNPPKKKKGELLYDEEQDSGLVGLMKKMSPARNPKDKTVSDATQKNILRALSEHRF